MTTARPTTCHRAVRTPPPATPTSLPTPGVEKLATGIDGLDAVLGGGILRGSALLLTGALRWQKAQQARSKQDQACRVRLVARRGMEPPSRTAPTAAAGRRRRAT